MSDCYSWNAHILRADWKAFKKLIPYGHDSKTKHEHFMEAEVEQMNHGGYDLHEAATAAKLRFHGATCGGHYSDALFASWGGRFFTLTADGETAFVSASDPVDWDTYYNYLAICEAIDKGGANPHFVEPLDVPYTGHPNLNFSTFTSVLEAVKMVDIATRIGLDLTDQGNLLANLIACGQVSAAGFMARRLAQMRVTT